MYFWKQSGDYIVIAIYMLVVIGISIWFSRGKKNAETYLLGGRNMSPAIIGVAIMMSLFSSVSLVMVPGEIFVHGLELFFLTFLVTQVFTVPAYLLFTRFYFKLGSFTPYEYLEYRYDPSIRVIVAITAFYGRIMYIAMVIYSTSKIFEGAFNWNPLVTIFLAGVMGVLCAMTGGSKAVIWIDLIQFFILLASFITLIAILCRSIDGGAIAAVATALNDGHGIDGYFSADFYSFSPYVRLLFWLLILGAVFSVFGGACNDQITIQRLLSTRNWKEGLKSRIISLILGAGMTIMLWFVGLALYTYYKQNPDAMLQQGIGDAVFFHFVSKNLQTPLLGLFIAAMLSAVMSTISSGINAMSTVWLKEFHSKFINRSLSPEREVVISRHATFIIGMFTCLLAFLLEVSGKWLMQSVAEVGSIFNLFGAAALPAFLFAVFSKRANSKLIWGYLFFSLGENIGLSIWYALSRAARQAWEQNPKLPWGFAGKLPLFYVLIPLGIGLVLLALSRQKWFGKITGRIVTFAGLILCGVAEGIGIWYLCSHWLITTEPLARSFAYGPPFSLLFATVALFFFPKQPREKWQGLTLGSIHEEIFPQAKQPKTIADMNNHEHERITT